MCLPRKSLALALAASVGGVVTLAAAVGRDERPWPPPAVPDAVGAPPLSAEQSLRTIVVPPGYRVELVAKEPLVQDPILVDFDPDGRMWVVEMPAFAMEESMADSRAPVCRVVVLDDEDGDGRMDHRTVFTDGLVLPRALKTLDKGALVGEPPYLWRMWDADGDGRMDGRTLVSDTFGRRDGNPEHNANSLIWGLDNWLYTSEHDWHLRYRQGRFETVPTLARGQWGGTIDDAGRVYRNVNNGPLFVDLVPARYFTRNPNLVRTRGLYEPLITLEEAVVWPVRPTRGVNRGYRDQFFRPDGTSTILQSAATPVVYRGEQLPAELRGGVFVTDSTTNLLHWLVVEDDGTGRLSARNGFARGEIFASTDERLRPVGAASAPDGTLYVVDMYRGVVQDVAYQTEYLQDYIRRNRMTHPIHRGRIWRIAHESTVRRRKPALSGETAAQLVRHLSDPNGWWRDTAQELIVQRGDASAVAPLEALLRETGDWRTRLHVLGALDGLGALEPGLLEPLLADPSPQVRAWAIRWSERWLGEEGHPLVRAVLARADDPSWTVRRQLAASIGELPRGPRVRAAEEILLRYGEDPIAVDAVVSGLHGLEAEVLDSLLRDASTAVTDDAVSMLAGAVARSNAPDAVPVLLRLARDAGASASRRSSVLRGLALGLDLGEPGGRPSGESPGRRVALPEEPTDLVSLAARTGDLADAARAALGHLDWPGRPAPLARVTPLRAKERRRFERGSELYPIQCAGCHGDDGRGTSKVAPSLVASPLAVGPAGLPIRVLLSGKEGPAGLMPPQATLDDAQVAAVLTYVRRAWGNEASPVAPDEVREIRGLTRVRTRPWTNEELGEVR